jgi:hypothetical protein
MQGEVLTTARLLRHPDRPVLLAVTTLRVTLEHTRNGSRARISEPANVAVAIPADHPDAPNLLRPGNVVTVEGMLERYVVPLRGVEIDRAVAALDDAWACEHDGLNVQVRRDAERRYRRQRQRLQETIRTRVIAGYVELHQGRPATIAEAQELRADQQRRRRDDQRQRAVRRERPPEVLGARNGESDVTDDPAQ